MNGKISIPRETLATLPLLNLLPEDRLDSVLRHSHVTTHPKRSIVLAKGQSEDSLGFLIAGKLQAIDHLAEGREVGLNIIEAGHFFGEFLVIDHVPRSASVIALLNSQVLWVPGAHARAMIYEHPPVAEAMLKHFAATIRRMSDLRTTQALPTAFQRVFALLDYIKEEAPGGLEQIADPPTHQEIAIMVNASRETVTRAIAKLIKANIVQKDLRRLIIRAPEQLRMLAHANQAETVQAGTESKP